jgi:hypothetical protein
MKRAQLFISLCLFLLSLKGFGQYTYTHEEAVSKGALALETNGISTEGGSDFISYGSLSLARDDLQSGFYLNVSDGIGGYYAPQFHLAPAEFTGEVSAVTGDFTGDGKVDVVLTKDSADLYIFRGNSSSADYFDAPKVQPLGQSNASLLGSVAAGDVNRDGRLDLVFGTEDDLVYSLGNGDGTFKPLQWIWGVSNDARVMTGNFNGDESRADIAVATMSCNGQQCTTHLDFFFGEASGEFTRPPVMLDYNQPIYFNRVLDVDSDGRSDLVGVSESFVRILKNPRNVFDRTLVVQDVPLAKSAFQGFTSVDAADFNGDGRNDLVVIEYDNTTRYIAILYALPDGRFSPEEYVFTDPNLRAVMAGRYNTGTLPDIAARTSESEFGSGTLHILKNNQLSAAGFPDCDPQSDPPANINICRITTVPNSTQVTFSIGAAFTSPLRKLELWIDGAKQSEGFSSYDQYSFLDTTLGVAAGQHTASFYAVSFDGRKINKKQTFTSGSFNICPAPVSPGINICSPGTTATSPVTVNATGQTANTTVRMELWVDGTKRASVPGNSLKTTVTLAAGPHRFSFYAIDSRGTKTNVPRLVTVN